MMFRPFRRPLTNPFVLSFGGLMLLAIGAGLLFAQPTPSAAREYTVVYVAGFDTIGVERVSVSDTSLGADLRMRGQPRIRWMQRLGEPAGVHTVHIDAWRPGAADTAAPMQRLVLRTRGDSAYVFAAPTAGAALGAPQAVLPARANAAWLVNQSLVHGAWVAQQASKRKDTSWVVMAAGAQVLPAAMVTKGDTLQLTIANLTSQYVFSRDGQLQFVAVPQQGLRGNVVTGSAAIGVSAPVTMPPSYDAPADAPYIAEHVKVTTPMGHTLAGTLTRPRETNGLLPAVVTISGSGPQERDVALPGIEGYRLFRQIADTLGRIGIAVLRLDDRGVGESGGTFATATSRDFAKDVAAAVAFLRARPDIDGDRIALIGHSEGGLVAPLVAAEDARLAGIALLAGPAYTGGRIIAFQQRAAINQMYPSAFASVRDSMFRDAQKQLDSTSRSNPWMREFITYDPLPTARRVRVPVLVLHGEQDLQVTVEQADSLAAAFRGGGNSDVTLRRLPRTNHLFQRDASGVPSGYGSLPDRQATAESLGALADWLVAKLQPR